CFVLVDLKLGKLTHQDLGQMQMYVNLFDRTQRVEHEAPTIGIVLCSEKNDAMARITLPEDNEQILAARYQMYLPSEAELRDALPHRGPRHDARLPPRARGLRLLPLALRLARRGRDPQDAARPPARRARTAPAPAPGPRRRLLLRARRGRRDHVRRDRTLDFS